MNDQPIYVLAPRHWKGSAYMTMNLTCLGYYFRKQIHKPIFISILGWARQIWSCHIHKFTWNFFRESGPNQRNVRLNEVPLVEGLLGWNRASPQETSTIINFKQFRNFFFFLAESSNVQIMRPRSPTNIALIGHYTCDLGQLAPLAIAVHMSNKTRP